MRKAATVRVHKMATMSDRITTRIDTRLKKKAVKVFDRLGLSEAEAIRLFYAQVELHQAIPFPLHIPNAETIAALKESQSLKKGSTYKNFRQVRDELGV